MRTPAQQQASRNNGAKSKGPVTQEGKAKSARNAVIHGFYSNAILLRNENPEAWRETQEDLIAAFQPATKAELNLVHEMALSTWISQRAVEMQAALINLEYDAIAQTEGPAPDQGQEILRGALAYARAIGRDQAIVEFGKHRLREGRHWMRLHTKLKEIQQDRRALEALAAETLVEENSRNEPENAAPPTVIPIRPPASLSPLAPTGTNDPPLTGGA